MQMSLEDFIKARLLEINKHKASLFRQLQAFDNEEEKLRRAADAAGIDYESVPVLATPVWGRNKIDSPARRNPSEQTIKQYVIDVLNESGRGMTALEILSRINEKFATNYPRTSLSPQLSRLKAERKLSRDGVVWSLSIEEKARHLFHSEYMKLAPEQKNETSISTEASINPHAQ